MITKNKMIWIPVLISFLFIILIVYTYTKDMNDRKINQQWYLNNTGQYIATQTGINGEDINFTEPLKITAPKSTIAIIDSGVNFNNSNIQFSQFMNNLEIPNNHIDDDNNGFIDDVFGWDFYNNDNSQYDGNPKSDHGTALVNILVGRDMNEYTPLINNVDVLSVKVFESGSYRISSIIDAIDYCEKMGVSIIIMSFELITYYEELYSKMRGSSIFFVCSAGNDNSYNVNYPASFNLENIIVVGGITNTGYPYEYTNYGELVDIYAPAKNIYSINSLGEYNLYSGTSFAVPQVAAYAYYLYEELNVDLYNVKTQIILNSRTSNRAYLNNQYINILNYN